MQYLANAVVAGALIVLVGIGVQVIYSTGRFFHFAHGAVLTFAAYIIHALVKIVGCPLWFAVILAMAVTSAAGVALDLAVYRPLRVRHGTPSTFLLASLGAYVVVVNVLAASCGDMTRSVRGWPVDAGYSIFGAHITGIQVFALIAAILGAAITWFFLTRTASGRTIRALAADPELAQAVGVDTNTTYAVAMAWGSFLAALAGILLAFDTDISPNMGLLPLMYAITAMVIGGNTLWGVVAGSFLVAGVLQFSVVWISSRWQGAIAFLILGIFLFVKPSGLLGGPLRKVSV